MKNVRCDVAYYNVCPQCGANLDPGEKCNCMEEKKAKQEFFDQKLKIEPKGGQYAFIFDSQEAAHEEKTYY